MQIKLSAHGAYHLKYHVVWVCTYRRKVLNPGVEATLRKLLPHLLRSMPGIKPRDDWLRQRSRTFRHRHSTPNYAIATVMGTLKGQSASYLRKKYPHIKKIYWKENIVWSPGYFVSSIGLDEATIKHDVETAR